MKKFIAAAAAALITCSAMGVTAFAEDANTDVFVTIVDKDSKIAVAQEAVTVTDIDSDGNAAAIELTGTLNAGKLTAEYNGDQMVFQLLEDGNIRLDKIIEDDNDTVTISVFYVRDEHIDEE